MSKVLFAVCILLLTGIIPNYDCQSFTSNVIPEQINGGSPIVSATDNSNTTMILCELFFGDTPIIITWRLLSGEDTILLSFTVNGTANNVASQPFSVTGIPTSQATTQSNLTIVNFTSSLDRSVLECFQGSDTIGNFTLRLIVLPVLFQTANEQLVIEGTPFVYDIQDTEGFPLIPDSILWYFNDVLLDGGSNPNISAYPLITFTDINRNHGGNYSVTVSNDAGTANGYVILDIQYGPEGVAEPNGPFYGLVGTDIMLLGFSDIVGNPLPSSDWSTNNGVINNGGRFTISNIIQLLISPLILSDSNNYTNTLSNNVNGTVLSITNTIQVIVVEPASSPVNISILSIGSEYVNISWINPINLGTPNYNQYRILVVSASITTINITIGADTNMYIITELTPNTSYNISIIALSTVEQLGLLTSEPSDIVQFNTTLGAPSISTAILQNSNGNLTISWEFLHTGGTTLQSITVQCAINDDDDDVSSSGDSLSVILICPEQCTTDSVTIGPVNAGMNYSCLITAENMIGDDEMRTNNILTNTGIPSVPVVTNVTGGAGLAYITLRIDNYGTTIANDFILTVTVFDEGDITNPIDTRDITPDSINNPVITLLVDNLPEGMLIFTVSASNVYGTPLMATNNMTVPVTIQPIPTTTTTITTTVFSSPTNTANSSGLSGGVIAGIIIPIVILIAIIAIIVFISIVYIIINNNNKNNNKKDNNQTDIPIINNEAYDTINKEPVIQDNIAYEPINSFNKQDTTRVYDTVHCN